MADVRESISKIVDKWFLYEPLFFNVYCTHKLKKNNEMKCAFRTGKRRIEYNPELLKDSDIKEIEQELKTEITRILLKHPYQRVPPYPNRAALTTASDVAIREHCLLDNEKLHDAHHYDFSRQLSYEEYYKKLSLICPNIDISETTGKAFPSIMPAFEDGQTWEYEAAAEASEFWDEDEEMADKVNQQIEIAQKTNQWGNISWNFKETITASTRIPMDYRRILSQFRASIYSQRRKLTRMKPNRRYGFEFMGSKFEPKTHLLVAVDVSGSISSEDLKNFFSIINRFFSYGVEAIHVIAFDTEIKQELELKKATREIQIIGRGGTDFQCAIDYYESHPEYQGLILFTDGYAQTPKLLKNKQILWILTGKYQYESAIEWIKELRFNKATWIPSVKSFSLKGRVR